MRFKTLAEWLSWQESLNPKEIDLGLDRVSEVLSKLNFSSDFICPVITVAGTNGKGSTVAFLESIFHQAGVSVGCYTSPHLFAYNERIRVDTLSVSDETLCEAFEIIDQARGETPLTYFEFGTLASLVVFQMSGVEVVVLEVGLGGRLDAVNVINADVSVITSIGVDHVDWLGDDVEVIAKEKAGVMRPHKTSVISLFKPPASLLEHAAQLVTPLQRLGHDYIYQQLADDSWQLKTTEVSYDDLPLTALQGGFQLQNASAAIIAVQSLNLLGQDGVPRVKLQNIKQGLKQVRLAGRYQQLQSSPDVFVDVAHNEQSATMLQQLLSDNKPNAGKTIGVIGMLSDKAVNEVIGLLQTEIDVWFSAGLDVPRGMSAKNIAQAVRGVVSGDKLSACESVAIACAEAMKKASRNDRVVIFGSFYTVAEATNFFHANS